MKKLLSILLFFILAATASAQSVYQSVHSSVYPVVHSVTSVPWEDYSAYNFYVDFLRSPIDRVSGTAMTTTLSAGRYDYLGNSFDENEPVIEPGKGLLGYGSYENLITYSENTTYWMSSVYTQYFNYLGNNIFQATTGGASLLGFVDTSDRIDTTEGTLYTLSFDIEVETGGELSGYRIYHDYSASGNTTSLPDLSPGLNNISIQFLGRTGDGVVIVRFYDPHASDYAEIYINRVQVTETPYVMPYIKTEGSTVTVPLNYADADEGAKFPIAAGSQLKTALYGTDGSDAQGRMVVKWGPMFDAADLSADVNILTANDEATSFLFWDQSENKIVAYDGTNSATADCTPVSGTEYEIAVDYDSTGMQVSVDGSAGSKVTFAGAFPHSTHLAYGWEAEPPQYVELSSIEKEPSW